MRFKTLDLDDIDRLDNDGMIWRPVRRTLGVTAFGINGYTGAAAGDEVIERHDENSPNSAHHEELYLVTSGRATFTVDGETFDAPVGTLVLVAPGVIREAVAAEPETTVLVIGGTPGAALPASAFEHWYAARPAFAAGDYDRATEIASEGLVDHPDSSGLHYELACYAAVGGRHDEAIEHLARAVAANPRMLEWAAEDRELDPIRGRPDYPTKG
jgi:mannose-6-phosphate isomerase-like protein (cupin superfamily)